MFNFRFVSFYKSSFILLFTLLISFQFESLAMAQAVLKPSEVSAHGRAYVYSCSQFSKILGDFSVSYYNPTLPWGTQIFMIYGLEGSDWKLQNGRFEEIPVQWQMTKEVEIFAYAGYSWSTLIPVTLHDRSWSALYRGLNFKFRIVLPDGREMIDNGNYNTNSADLGHYLAILPNQSPKCVSNLDSDLPLLAPILVEVIQ